MRDGRIVHALFRCGPGAWQVLMHVDDAAGRTDKITGDFDGVTKKGGKIP